MKKEKRQIWKSISLLFFALTTSLFLFTNCSSDDDDDFIEPTLTVSDEGQIEFEKDADSKTIDIKTNRDWKVTVDSEADWIDVTPKSGVEGSATLTVTVKSNDGIAREGFFTVVASTAKKTVTVTQKGEDGSTIEYTTIEDLRSMYADKGVEEWTIEEPLRLKAVVISDRAGGNSPSLKNGFMQDQSGKGVAFRVTESIHEFNLGDEVSVNLEGAKVSEYAGAVQLGFSTTKATVQEENVDVTPKELTIEEVLDGSYDAVLVKLKDVQFKDYEGLSFYEGEESATNRTLENCDGANIIARTTKYANFKDQELPAGNGHIMGIMSVFNGTWQLAVRNTDDLAEMSDDASTRCTPDTPPVSGEKISIADFRAAINDGETYTEDKYIEGEIVLNPFNNNVPSFVAYIADETGGVALTFSDSENILSNVPIGAQVKVGVKGTKAKEFNGLLQIGDGNSLATSNVEIVEKTPSTPLQPKAVTLDELLEGKYQSQLVEVKNVQFKETGVNYKGSQTVINSASDEVTVYTRNDATFAEENVKEGNGSFIGVVSIYNSPQLLIRSVDDLSDMTGDRFTVSSIETDVSSVTFEKAGGNETIDVTANVNWTVSSNESWLTVSPASGSNNGSITATATANDGAERSAVITITDGTVSTLVSVIQKGEAASGGDANDLFFSEYVEGGGFNKFIEIYNGTGATVDLSDYKVETYMNGATETDKILELTGTLNNGEVIVIYNSQATIEPGTTNAIIDNGIANFNGDDAVAIIKKSTGKYVDIIGRIGEREDWSAEGDNLSTKDRTLVRKPSIKSGVTENPAAGFPTLATEWIGYPKDTADYLGSHTMN